MILQLIKKPLILIAAIIGYGCFPLPAQRGEFTETEFESMSLEMSPSSVNLIDPKEVKSSYKILDAREPKEYEISHIENSDLIGYDNFDISTITNKYNMEDTIVVYCSVGYRSGKIAEKLQKKGFKNVYNLKGGVFRWANEERELIDPSTAKTNTVHGFNEKWSKWLKKEVPTVF